MQDHLVQRGGAERVLPIMAAAFGRPPVYTSFYAPERCYPDFATLDVRPAPIDRIGPLRLRHRSALPLMPRVFDHLRVDAEVTICATSGWAAGAATTGRKVLYFHAVARWLHEREAYLEGKGVAVRGAVSVLDRHLRTWDAAAVRSGHRFLANSQAVAAQVSRVYGIEAEVLEPPLALEVDGLEARPPALAGGSVSEAFVLCPCRLLPYKNVEAVIDAFRQRPHDQLVIAGGGPDEARLRQTLPTNVVLLGAVDDLGMRWLYRRARLVASAAYEPFGLIAVEAAANGVPMVALASGGFLSTVIAGVTGATFTAPEGEAIAEAIERADGTRFDQQRLREHAQRWAPQRFQERLRSIITEERSKGG